MTADVQLVENEDMESWYPIAREFVHRDVSLQLEYRHRGRKIVRCLAKA